MPAPPAGATIRPPPRSRAHQRPTNTTRRATEPRIATNRSTRRRSPLTVLQWLIAVGSILAVLAWAAVRLASDRYAWSQQLSWAPPAGVMLGLGLVGMLSLLFGLRPPRRAHTRTSRSRSNQSRTAAAACRLAAIAACAAIAYIAVADFRPHRVITASKPEARAADLRVLFWNGGNEQMRADALRTFTAGPNALGADLVLLTSPNWWTIRWGGHTLMQEINAELAEHETGFLRSGRFLAASSLPIRRYALVNAGPVAPEERLPIVASGGTASNAAMLWLELDASRRGGPADLSVWLVDLPSDVRLRRTAVVDGLVEAAAAIQTVMGPDAVGGFSPHEGKVAPPDIVIGDMNTPAGSASLGRFGTPFEQPLTEAHTQAGVGLGATWPTTTRERQRLPRWLDTPLASWRIDQALLGPRTRATWSVTEPWGKTGHNAIRIGIAFTPFGEFTPARLKPQ